MYGVLYGVYGLGMHVIPAAWEAAGLNAADAPQSYEELLDFAGRWAERVEAGEVGDIRLNALRSCGYLMNDRRYTLWLTDLLLDIWIMRHQSAGEALVFNTPAFIALADQARETGRALVKAEKSLEPPRFRSTMSCSTAEPAMAALRTCIPMPFPCA